MPQEDASQAQSEIWFEESKKITSTLALASIWYRQNDKIDVSQAVAVVWFEPKEGRVYGPAIISM